MINALKNQPQMTIAKGAATQPAQNSFGLSAESALSGVIAKAMPTSDDQLKTQAQNLIGTTFFATMLKQMHDSPFKSELFSGGRGGEAFGGLMDQHLAERMSARVGAKLTRPIIKKYAKANAKAAEAYEKQKLAKDGKDGKAASDAYAQTHAKETQYVPGHR